jgi:PST family polysaccharide transporter
LGTVIQAKLILALCSLIIFTAMIPFVAILRENILLGYLYLVAILLSLWLPDFMFRGIERMEIITVRFIISKTITTALIFILVHSASDVIWLPVLNIMGTLVAIYLTWYEIKKRLKIQVYYSTIKASLTALKVSSIYFISNFATTAFGATNAFMLGVMSLPAAHIGYWGVSYVLISSAQAMYSPIAVSLYPHMVARKDFKLVRKILLLFMPPIVIATAVVYILAEPIIVLISGSEYDGAVSVFRAMLPVLLCSFPAMIIGFPVLGAIGKVKETTTTTVISSLFHIIGLLLLAFMGQFTVLNVAILRSLTEAVLLVSRVYVCCRLKM